MKNKSFIYAAILLGNEIISTKGRPKSVQLPGKSEPFSCLAIAKIRQLFLLGYALYV